MLERQARIVESLVLGRDDWWGSDLWDRVRPQSPDGVLGVMPSVASDRRHGDKWPFYRDEQTHSQLRQRSRVLTETGGYGEGLLRNLVNYAVAGGFTYEVISKETLPDADPKTPGKQVNPQVEAVVARCQDILDRVLEKNAWNGCASHDSAAPLGDTGEMELCSRVLQDGDAFVRDHDDEDGLLAFCFIEPEQIQNPPDGKHEDGWSWGIQHQMTPFEDVRRPVAYHVAWMDSTTAPDAQAETINGEVVDADRVTHVKAPGTRSTVKRGRPFFSYDTAAALERAAKLQGNLSWGAAIRAAAAETWQHDFGTADQISQLERGLANRTRTNPITGNTEYILDSRPGQRRRIPQGQKLVEHTADHSPSHLQAVQGDLRQAATPACAPEYVISADASNNNFASIKEAGTPFVRFIESLQGLLRAAFQRLAWKALRYAARCGLVPLESLSLIDIQVEAPRVVQRDALQQAQEDQILIPLGVKSKKTAQMERQLNPDIESANMLEEQAVGGAEPEQPETPEAAPPTPGERFKDMLPVSKALSDLQVAFYAGELPRPAALANAVHVLGVPPQVAEILFAPVKPVKLADDGAPPAGPFGQKPPGGPPGSPPGGPPKPQPPGQPPQGGPDKSPPGQPPGGGQPKGGPPQPAPPTQEVREVTDDSGHKHDEKGLFTGPGGGGVATGGNATKPAKAKKEKYSPQLSPAALYYTDKKSWGGAGKPNPKLPRESQEYLETLNEKHAAAVAEWTNGGYKAANAILRTGQAPAIGGYTGEQIVKHLPAVFESLKPFQNPVSVVRGMQLFDSEPFEKMVGEAMSSGQPIQFKGYMSTTTRTNLDDKVFEQFRGNVILEIEAKQGLDVKPISRNHREDELLLNHDSKFKVTAATKEGGVLRVKMEQVL